jgi:hypothetical protein
VGELTEEKDRPVMGCGVEHAPMRSQRSGEAHDDSGPMLTGEADRSHERHRTAARKLTGQTPPVDTATIITGNF